MSFYCPNCRIQHDNSPANGFIVQQSQDGENWRGTGDSGPFCLRCAKAIASDYAASHKDAPMVAVFKNVWNFAEIKPYILIDRHDKSNSPISAALGGLINSLESDWF